jgi:acyl carrier protein
MENKLKMILSDLLGLSPDVIGEDFSMDTVSEWDSMKHMEIIAAIEENFNIPQLSMDEIVVMTSFAKIKEILQSKGL